MSYYQANRLREAAKWTRRVGYTLLPIIIIVSAGIGQGEPDALTVLMTGAIYGAIVLGITEAAGFFIEKAADRMAKQ